MVGVVVVVDSERSDVGGNREVAAFTDDSVVLRILTRAKEGFSHAFNRSVFFAVVEVHPLVGGSSGSATSLGGMSKVHAALDWTGERQCVSPERVGTAIAGVRGLNDYK